MRTALLLLGLLLFPAVADVLPCKAGARPPTVESLLVAERRNVVCFYSSSDPVCRALHPSLLQYGADPRLTLHMIDVGTPGSPACAFYGISSVPSFQIYDRRGILVSEGAAAYRTVTASLPRR